METSRTAAVDGSREKILAAAIALLSAGGREAVSTRAVCAAAGVQPPTLYRLFGDKQGLLDAMVAHGYTEHLASHAQLPAGDDPVDDLRVGWDVHVRFGLDHPYLYSLMYGEPRRGPLPQAAAAAEGILAGLIHRIAGAGRLRVPEDRAVALAIAVGSGTVLTLIAMPEEHRDAGLSALARDAMVAAITTDDPVSHSTGAGSAAIALRAALPESSALTTHERGLLREWLDRIADPPAG